MHLPTRAPSRLPAALVVFACFAHAQPTLGLAQVLTEVRNHRQEIRAGHLRAEAAAQTPKVVSALPDPMVMGGLDHLPFSLMGANYSVQVQQGFPLSRIRAHQERSALYQAEAWRAQAAITTLDVEVAALRSFLMLAEVQRMQAVVADLKKLAMQILTAVHARVASAQASLSESVRAESELARLQGELDALEREVAGAWAMTEAAMGHAVVRAEVPLAELSAPTEPPPDLAVLVASAIDQRPEVARTRAELGAARANVQVMESMYYPMAFVRVGAANTMTHGPGAMAMIGLTLPVWRDKLSAGVAEASAMGTMAEAKVAALQTMIAGEVAASRERVLAARARFLATRDRVVPLARQSVDLALNAYIAGQQPLVSVLDAMRAQGDVQLDSVRAEVQLAGAWIDLGRATGKSGVAP